MIKLSVLVKDEIGSDMMKKMWIWILFAAIFANAGIVFSAGMLEYKLVTQKNITEYNEIQTFRAELFLGTEAIDRILVTDVLNDGFDENDQCQLYPSGRVLRLKPISPALDALLRSYLLPSNVAVYESKKNYLTYDELSRERSGGRALGYGILGGIESRLSKGYRGQQVEGYFKMAPSGATIQLWNFDSTRVGFPPAEPNPVDTVYILKYDTIRVPEVITVTSEPIIIRDTVFIPEELMKKRSSGFYYRKGLGTIGGSYDLNHRESSRGRLILGAGNEWDFGVWEPWISGRQDIDSRFGLRFLAEMAPWKSDTLSPRFLSTSFETMYIPAWDRKFFIFGGVRLFYHDDLFWDRVRAAWDEDLYKEEALQDLSQYEFTAKFGLDKFSSFGTGKHFGAWLKITGFTQSNNSKYDLELEPKLTGDSFAGSDSTHWGWEHKAGLDAEAAVIVRLSELAQISLSVGNYALPKVYYDFDSFGNSAYSGNGEIELAQLYQTASIRFVPYSVADQGQLALQATFRNNTLATKKLKSGSDEAVLEKLFYPYFETPVVEGSVQWDVSAVRVDGGVKYYMPPKGLDPQLQPFVGLRFVIQ